MISRLKINVAFLRVVQCVIYSRPEEYLHYIKTLLFDHITRRETNHCSSTLNFVYRTANRILCNNFLNGKNGV